jgi:hypothetical protein
MMPPILAEAQIEAANNWQMLTALGVIVSVLVGLTALVRTLSGKDSERQIEPTQIHAITSELHNQTVILGKLDREMGETRNGVNGIADEVRDLKKIQREDIDKAHLRINGISRDVASTSARIDGLERICTRNHA